MHAIEHLESVVWSHPSHYFGFSPDGDYLIASQHRESDTLTRSNWQVACNLLGAQAWDSREMEDRPNAYHWRASCSLVGWIEYLCVRADAPDNILQEAGEILCSLADYPVLSDDHFSNLEFEEACTYWEQCSVADRLDLIQRSGCGVSIFAARHAELPSDDNGALLSWINQG